MEETREHEEHKVTVTKGKMIHSITITSLFSYRFLFYTNRRMEVTTRRCVAMVIPALVDLLTQLGIVEFGSFRKLPNFFYPRA